MTRTIAHDYPSKQIDVGSIAGRATITVEEAALLLGIGRTAAYEAARRGQLPTRRLGRRLFVPVPAFLNWLGINSLYAPTEATR